jgi:hypothetical protein
LLLQNCGLAKYFQSKFSYFHPCNIIEERSENYPKISRNWSLKTEQVACLRAMNGTKFLKQILIFQTGNKYLRKKPGFPDLWWIKRAFWAPSEVNFRPGRSPLGQGGVVLKFKWDLRTSLNKPLQGGAKHLRAPRAGHREGLS